MEHKQKSRDPMERLPLPDMQGQTQESNKSATEAEEKERK